MYLNQPSPAMPDIPGVHLKGRQTRILRVERRQGIDRCRLDLVHPEELVSQESKPACKGDHRLRSGCQRTLDEIVEHGTLFDPRAESFGGILEAIALRIRSRGAEGEKCDVELVLFPKASKQRQRGTGIVALKAVIGVQHRCRGIGDGQKAIIAHLQTAGGRRTSQLRLLPMG